ncbi:MAG: tetraacyldisaccharide 4'-kinase [Chlamydiia bacterium]|nr:tetraacyldisaccharide 4'-kinase [Chlamydiia bacterium]
MRNQLFLWGLRRIERGAWFFAPLSWVWAFVVFLKNCLYDRGWKAPARVSCAVVSVGNLVAGGTGKTPFVHALARAFSHRKTAILSRGYGKLPDEALLLQRLLPDVSVYIGKDRVALARRAVREGAELILLDDGFQHRRLHRDLDIVLLTKEDPFGKGHYLPWGLLRDSPKRLHQADAVFMKGKDFRHRPSRIVDESGVTMPSIEGWRVGIFSGLANPASFEETVKELAAEVVSVWFLADHEKASFRRLLRFSDACKTQGASALLTTAKDFIKFTKLPRTSLPLFYIESELQFLAGQSQWEALIAKIEERVNNAYR